MQLRVRLEGTLAMHLRYPCLSVHCNDKKKRNLGLHESADGERYDKMADAGNSPVVPPSLAWVPQSLTRTTKEHEEERVQKALSILCPLWRLA